MILLFPNYSALCPLFYPQFISEGDEISKKLLRDTENCLLVNVSFMGCLKILTDVRKMSKFIVMLGGNVFILFIRISNFHNL